jgi:hypothetical protein
MFLFSFVWGCFSHYFIPDQVGNSSIILQKAIGDMMDLNPEPWEVLSSLHQSATRYTMVTLECWGKKYLIEHIEEASQVMFSNVIHKESKLEMGLKKIFMFNCFRFKIHTTHVEK